MNDFAWLGFSTTLAFIFLAVAAASLVTPNARVRRLMRVGLLLRVVGALLYYLLTKQLYNGGDYLTYYDRGLYYASRFQALDFSALTDQTEWIGAHWWGTQFLYFVSGFTFSLIGPGMLGGFLVFSLLAFVGLAAFGVAYHRNERDVGVERYLRWVWLFPSLWFWPSVIGKEAVVLLGLGLCVAGYAGRSGRVHWVTLLAGVLLVFCVRPQVAMVVIMAIAIAQWLATVRHWSVRTAIQGLLMLAVSIGGIWASIQYLGIGDVREVGDYLQSTSATADRSGSTVEGGAVGIAGIPVALLNILFRPFPWEIRNSTSLLSSLEIVAFWLVVLWRRTSVMRALRGWRSDRLKRMAVPFILIYSVTLGMVVVNLGIIARQRIFLFPFLFLFLDSKRPVAPLSAPGSQRFSTGKPPFQAPSPERQLPA